MKITNIKPQVKRAGRYSIFIDDKYSFSLAEADLIYLKLKVGQEIDQSDLEKFNVEADYSKAKTDCFRLLSYRLRSIGEVRDYLRRRKYEPEVADRVIEFLIERDFLNDEKFANQWVENRLLIKQSSIRQIKSELRQKKVDSKIIDNALNEFSVDEVKLLRILIDKKRNQTKYRDELKLKQYLSRKGFGYDKIVEAMKPEN